MRADDSAHEFVDHAIRRTLDAPQLQFLLYRADIWSEDRWNGHRVEGWWWGDGSELFTTTTRCSGTGAFVPNLSREGTPAFSAIRGATRTTWRSSESFAEDGTLSPVAQQDGCFQRIDGAPSESASLARTWANVVSENIAYESTVPMLETTPMEILAALRDTGFELFDPPVGSQRSDPHRLRYNGALRMKRGPDRSAAWRGYIGVDGDGFVSSFRLRSKQVYLRASLYHADVAKFTDPLLAIIPDVVNVDSLIATGREVVMPAHSLDIASNVLGPLDDLDEPHHPGVYPDFAVGIEGAEDEHDLIANAIHAAAPRIMALTCFGREIETDDELELVYQFDMIGPNYVSDPIMIERGAGLGSDWKGEALPDAANACLAIVVQELLAAGVSRASIRRLSAA